MHRKEDTRKKIFLEKGKQPKYSFQTGLFMKQKTFCTFQ